MTELALTPQQILRNMLQRRPAGSAAGASSADNPLRGLLEERDSRLDSFKTEEELRLGYKDEISPYELDVGGQLSKDLTGYRIPIVSDLGNAINAYIYGKEMNEYRDAIREKIDNQLESEGIEKGSSEYQIEILNRMPDVGNPEAMVEFGVGAAIGAPLLKGSFGALKALYDRIPKETRESTKSETKDLAPIDNPEMIKSLGRAYLNE